MSGAGEGAAPVASVLVDTGLPHLDRPFEYAVPAELDAAAVPGARVKVRFAGRDRDGLVLARSPSAEHQGRLSPLRRVVSDEPVLTDAVLATCRRVATWYGGTLGDVMRLAIPPRHARAEAALAAGPKRPRRATTDDLDPGTAWADYPAGAAFLRRVAAGESPAASWLALPDVTAAADPAHGLAEAVAAARSSGRGALIVVPDRRDVDTLDAALREVLGPRQHVRLTADQGPQARYTAFLTVLRGHVRVVVGTRAAAFAPVRDLGLVAWWDDGDDLHAEPRAPYPHVREVLRIRAEVEGAALLVAGYARSVALQDWVERGEVKPIDAPRGRIQARTPRVRVASDAREVARDSAAGRARLPTVAWQTAKDALAQGPVLIQVPRRGYAPALACDRCRAAVRCPACQGPMAVPGPGLPPRCRWCGSGTRVGECAQCGGTSLRATVVGARRTAEELGRAFPGSVVRTSGAGQVLDRVGTEPALVIATPGAEPLAERGYAAALLLDAWALLDRPSLDAAEEALRRWLAAAALVRAGGQVVLAGSPGHVTVPAVEALVRWDPVWLAARELADRRTLGLPPASTMALVRGDRSAVSSVVSRVQALAASPEPTAIEVVGPSSTPDGSAAVLRVAPQARAVLAGALAAAVGERSARKEADTVRVRMDPPDPGAALG